MTPDPSRARRLLVALAICATVLIAVTAWMAMSRANEKPVPVQADKGAGKSAGELSASSHAASERMDLSTSLVVSSRAGLPIESVFLSGADGAWHARRASDGQVERAELKDMTRICAPGHLPITLDAHASSIVLDVDAMLVIHCPDLKTILASASEVDGRRNNFAECAGFIDDDTLGCAVACHMRPTETLNDAVSFDLIWLGKLKTRIRFHPESGKIVEWNTTGPEAPPRREFVLNLVRNADRRSAVKVAARVESLAGVRPSSEGTGPGATPLQSEVAFPWGTVNTAWSPFEVANNSIGRADEVDLGHLPLGAKISLTAQDPDFGDWGMLACIHDGTTHDVRLRAPVRLHGKFTVADGSPLPVRIEVTWLQRFSVADNPAWETSDSSCAVNAEGSWMVSGPRHLRCGAASSSVVPPFMDVQIEAPGFAPVTVRQTIGDVQNVELDSVRLEPLAPDIVIHPHSEQGLDGFRLGGEMTLQSESGQIDAVRIARVWPRTDGTMAVWFRRANSWSSSPSRDRIALILAGTVRIVTNSQWHEWRGFVRGTDVTFEELDREAYQVELVLPKDSERVWMRLNWFGIECESRLLIPRPVETRVDVLKLPVGPVQIGWKCAKPDSEWSFASLLPGRQRLEHLACPLETK